MDYLINLYKRASSFLKRYGQAATLVLGLTIAVGGAYLWHRQILGQISGSLLVGLGASVIAGTITAYFAPFNQAAFRKFISLGIGEVWSSRSAVPERDWVDSLNRAKYKCVLLGVAHGNWCHDERFEPALRDRLEHGVHIDILFLDPDSLPAEVRDSEEKRDTKEKIRESIEYMWKIRQERLDAKDRQRLRLYVYNATPSCGLMWVDDYMIVTHYLAGRSDLTSPAVRIEPAQVGTGGLYDVYAKNLEEIQNGKSEEIDDRNIERLLPNARRIAGEIGQIAQGDSRESEGGR